MSAFIDLVGRRFGMLTVVSRAGYRGKCITWHCVCECGGEKVVPGTYLSTGDTKSCGCRANPKGHEHGMWRGGRTIHSDGRPRVYMPDHPRASQTGYVFEHILTAEHALCDQRTMPGQIW